jgi:DNA-binding transcriptional MerR regulator
MRYLNAAQTAKRLGVADKTVRRWLAEGKLVAKRTASNQLAIAEADIEKFENERGNFVSADQSVDVSRIDELEARIKELEQEVTELKDKIAIIEKGKKEAVLDFTSDNTDQKSRAQKRIVERNRPIPANLPPGTLPATEFAAKIGLPYDSIKNFIRRGVFGHSIDFTEIAGVSGRSSYFFTVEQQEATLALLREYGKIQ